jgi:hypothetical protein
MEGFVKEDLEKRDHWRRQIEAWKSSGLSRRVYCEQNGIKISTLDYWCQKLKPSGAKSKTDKTGWIPLKLDDDEPSSAIDLRIGRIRIAVKPGFDRTLLVELLQTISAIC